MPKSEVLFKLRRDANDLQLTNGSEAESNRSAYVGRRTTTIATTIPYLFPMQTEMKIGFLDSQLFYLL
jgi:hypothetical protein